MASHSWVTRPGTTQYHYVMAMNLRLTPEQTEHLRDAAARDGLSMQAAAVKAVEEYSNRRAQRRAELLEQIVSDNSGLLDRLADA